MKKRPALRWKFYTKHLFDYFVTRRIDCRWTCLEENFNIKHSYCYLSPPWTQGKIWFSLYLGLVIFFLGGGHYAMKRNKKSQNFKFLYANMP